LLTGMGNGHASHMPDLSGQRISCGSMRGWPSSDTAIASLRLDVRQFKALIDDEWRQTNL